MVEYITFKGQSLTNLICETLLQIQDLTKLDMIGVSVSIHDEDNWPLEYRIEFQSVH